MIVNSSRPFWELVGGLWMSMLPIVGYVSVIAWLDIQYHLEEFDFPPTMLAILGTVIGLLLAFRTNSSYDRWWEARTIWGAIVNDSRSWVRQLLEFTQLKDDEPASQAIIHRMAYRQIAWCFALSRSLRKQNATQDLQPLLEPKELESYRPDQNVPNEILLEQARDLRHLYQTNQLELYQFVELEKTLVRLTNSMGGCERIKNTPFPTSYNRMVHGLIYLFVIFLPFGLSKMISPGLVLISLSLSLGFLVVERVSIYLQDPFSNRPSDTPVLGLSRTIEINIKQMLKEEDIPEKWAPIKGVLY